MKSEQIETLTGTFEAHAQQTESEIEYWLARDLQHLLGYTEWRNFTLVINKAKTSCEVSGHEISDHFVDVNKMVQIGSGTTREIEDMMLTRYACYLIAQNGDPRKPASGRRCEKSGAAFIFGGKEVAKRSGETGSMILPGVQTIFPASGKWFY